MPTLKKRKGESVDQQNIRTEMTEMKAGKLHSGSKTGPKVTNPKQAIAIGFSKARKAKGTSPKMKAPKMKMMSKKRAMVKKKKK